MMLVTPVGVDGDRGLGKGHAKGREHGVGTSDRRGDGGRVVDIAAGDLETPMLDREGVSVSGEGDHVVVLAERQLGEESSGRAIGPEHCDLHQSVPSMYAQTRGRAGSSTRTPASPGV